MPRWPGTQTDRFWSHVDKTEACWLWTAARFSNGYGLTHRNRLAHRVAYELVVGPIPSGLELDHLCRVRHCVNPAHLEPVTGIENRTRGNLSRDERGRYCSA